jgi:acetyl-CoA synthetase
VIGNLASGPGLASVRDTAADDRIIYTSGISQRGLIGNLQPGDMFWSPADWAWTGGLFDVPCCRAGTSVMPLLAYKRPLRPGEGLWLIEKYGMCATASCFPPR